MNAKGAIKRCWSGDCYVTADKSLYSNPLASAFLFNGVMFDVSDLPLPRKRKLSFSLYRRAGYFRLKRYPCTINDNPVDFWSQPGHL